MDQGKRRKALSMILEKLKSIGYFKSVKGGFPKEIPNAIALPAAFMMRAVEMITYSTNQERSSSFPFAVVLYLHSADDIELVKCDAEDKAEQAMIELFVSSEWRDLGLSITLERVDAGAYALAPLGFEGGINAPFGAIRMDFTAVFDYNAQE